MKNITKIKNLTYATIPLFFISFLMLPFIQFNTEYIFNMDRFIFIRFLKMKQTNPNIDIGDIIIFMIVIYCFLIFAFKNNKIFLILNQIIFTSYLFVYIYPVTFGKYEFFNKSSNLYFFINLIIILALNLLNIYKIKKSNTKTKKEC